MKCEKHPERDAVGYCAGCTTFGCDLCLDLATDERWYCHECMEKEGKVKAEIEEQEVEEELQEGPKAPPADKRAIQKLVAHYADGRIIKGVAYKLEAEFPGFYLIPRGAKEEEQELYIKFAELKAVFLVRDFDGGPAAREVEREFIPEGHEIEVYFKDGETLKGYALGEYSPESKRFHVIPRDRTSNNISVLVERSAVEKVEVGEVFKAKEYRELSDTPVKKLIFCHYWDNLGKVTTFQEIASAIERTEHIVKRDIEVFFRNGLMERTGETPEQKIVFLKPPDEVSRKLLSQRVEDVKKYLPRR